MMRFVARNIHKRIKIYTVTNIHIRTYRHCSMLLISTLSNVYHNIPSRCIGFVYFPVSNAIKLYSTHICPPLCIARKVNDVQFISSTQ